MINEIEDGDFSCTPAADAILFVENYNEIITNFREFQKIDNHFDSVVYHRFATFFHWYYLPIDDGIYAPSIFIGYKNTTIENYPNFKRSGFDSEKVLKDYFFETHKGDKDFLLHYPQLNQFAEELGKKINQRVKNGIGAIHLPNEKFILFLQNND